MEVMILDHISDPYDTTGYGEAGLYYLSLSDQLVVFDRNGTVSVIWSNVSTYFDVEPPIVREAETYKITKVGEEPVKVVEPRGVSEDLFLKALAVAQNPELAKSLTD